VRPGRLKEAGRGLRRGAAGLGSRRSRRPFRARLPGAGKGRREEVLTGGAGLSAEAAGDAGARGGSGRAGGARGPLRGSAGPSGELGRARVGEEVWAGRCTGPGRGKRGKGKWAGLVFAGLGLRVWVFLSNFYFFSKSNSNKI
jgi:hypothetical protein